MVHGEPQSARDFVYAKIQKQSERAQSFSIPLVNSNLDTVHRACGIGPAGLDQKFITIKIFMKPNPKINTNFDSIGPLFYH